MKGPTMGAPPDAAPPPLPWLFFIVAIVGAVAVGAVLGYLGLTGHLGGGIPGSKSPSGGINSLPIVGVALTLTFHALGKNPP
ncbi:MAG: hypothetical protein WA688_07555 [Thermoplasmata archaeon]